MRTFQEESTTGNFVFVEKPLLSCLGLDVLGVGFGNTDDVALLAGELKKVQ